MLQLETWAIALTQAGCMCGGGAGSREGHAAAVHTARAGGDAAAAHRGAAAAAGRRRRRAHGGAHAAAGLDLRVAARAAGAMTS